MFWPFKRKPAAPIEPFAPFREGQLIGKWQENTQGSGLAVQIEGEEIAVYFRRGSDPIVRWSVDDGNAARLSSWLSTAASLKRT